MSKDNKIIIVLSVIGAFLAILYYSNQPEPYKPEPNLKLTEVQHKQNIRIILKKLQRISQKHANTYGNAPLNLQRINYSISLMRNLTNKLYKISSGLDKIDLEWSFRTVETIKDFDKLKKQIKENCNLREKANSSNLHAIELLMNDTISSDSAYEMIQVNNSKIDAYNQSIKMEVLTTMELAHKYNLKYNKK